MTLRFFVFSGRAALFLCAVLAGLASSSQLRADLCVSDFEEQALASKLDPVDNVYKGEVGAPSSFRSGKVAFSNDGHYFTEFAGVTYDSWSGTGFSRKSALTQGNFWDDGNDLVITPAAAGGANTWGVVYYSATLEADSGYIFDSLAITNTAYTSYVMTHDDAYGGPAFSEGDFFTVTFTNPETNASIEYALADYRSPNPADRYVISNWDTVPLASLNASKLNVGFSGSRIDPIHGLATPAYAAIDNVTVSPSAVPEPSSLALLAAGSSVGVWFRWRKSKRSERSTEPLLG